METAAQKLAILVRDLQKTRVETERRPHTGSYLGIGATIRVPDGQGTRFVSVYGNDIPGGLLLMFFENGTPISNAWSTYLLGPSDTITKHVTYNHADPLGLLQKSQEFRRQGITLPRHTTTRTVTRNEIVFLDDTLRHAICQAATFQSTEGQSSITIQPQQGIRLPVRHFNKRLPDHSNALRLWLEYRNPTLPPESQHLISGLPYSLHRIKGDEYEGGVALSVAGALSDLANPFHHPDGPLVRMHSACSFSEKGRIKGYTDRLEYDSAYCKTLSSTERPYISFVESPSQTCDCRQQMIESQRLIAAQGGIFADFYEQEGRGYGLLNKEEFFYRLFEEEGINTADICEKYQINPDIRTYDSFVAWLKSANIHKVRLIGNNPRKRQALEDAGITVTPIGLWLPTKDNIEYLRTKRDKLAHDIPQDAELQKYMIDPISPFLPHIPLTT